MPFVHLQPEHMALCEQHALAVMRNRSARSRAVSWRDGKRDSLDVQLNGRACEWAAAMYFGLDPRRALNWDSYHGDETDLSAEGRNIDVKGSRHAHAKLLIYSREITQWYNDKNFDTLLFARAKPLPTVELVGWISKSEFLRTHVEAPAGKFGHWLDPGTWYVHMDELWDLSKLGASERRAS